MQATSKAHIAVIFTNLFFAANYSLVKFISPELIKPYALNILRVGVSIILLWTIWLFGKTAAGIRKEHAWRFFLCGLTGVAINQTFFIKGLTLTSTIHASLLMLCTPLLITLFAFWILKESMTISKALGVALGIGGAAILILTKESGTGNGSSLTGDLLIILNAISYTVYFILVKPLMAKYNPVHVVRWVFTFGFLMVLPIGWIQIGEIEWSHFEWKHIATLSFIVICGTFLAYYFNVYGIQHLGAGITGTYIYTQPLLAAIIAIIFLDERITLGKIIAAILIALGVFLVSFRKK